MTMTDLQAILLVIAVFLGVLQAVQLVRWVKAGEETSLVWGIMGIISLLCIIAAILL